ncbi:hypothetical protein HPB50_017494 [Hyalomma asiaticum]|uniref:Uncharacterized protein n=1 Tax=Hyalomma asiaticum TaxID=266040 RepID=A0ACB7RN98_HYAAI|nr:hypothetical protein HPB50_017494 [Hyalomma asiaticum]
MAGFLAAKRPTGLNCPGWHVPPLYGVAYYNTTKYRGSLWVWIEDFIPHPKFEMASVWNDVALVRGDSGGPLTVKSRKGRILQVGIVSYGKGCGRPYDPGMYARVDNYMRWIKQQISNPRPPRWHVPALEDKTNNSGRIFDVFR